MKNADYWRGRFSILEESAHQEADQYIQSLEEMFMDAQRTVQADIERWYGRFASNNGISLTEARKMLTTGQLEEFRWTVDQYIKIGQQANLSAEWLKKLENASAKFHVSRLEAIQTQIQQQIELLYGNQLDGLDSLLKKIAGDGYTQSAFAIQKGIGLGWDITALNQKKLETLLSKPWTTDGRTFSDRIWSKKKELVGSVQKELTQGLLRGDSPQKITDAIKNRFNVSRYQAGRLVHTETTYFNAISTKQAYQDLGVEKVEILETLDSHTCEICQPLDGTVIPLSQYEPGVTVPPFHPNCRGTTCPHFADMDGERAARNAEGKVYYVPANMTYTQWKKAFVDGGSKDGLTVATVAGVLKRVRDYESEFGKKFGKDHYDQIRDRVDACENPNLQKVWDAYEGKIKVADPHYNGGAYCSGNNIYVGINKDAKGRKYFSPYSTTFHESGHAIDGLAAQLGSPNGQWHFSSTYKDGLFPKTIKEEVDDWVKSILSDMKAHKSDFQYWVDKGWITQGWADYYASQANFKPLKSMAFQAVKQEIQGLEPLQMCDISDILEGATRGKIQCGVGHGGGSYWTNRAYNGIDWGLGTEAFAEMTSATMACPESLETIKKYLPKSYALYEEMLEVIANQI